MSEAVCAWDLLKEVTIISIESENKVAQSCPTLRLHEL